jgi:hypothetical protein
VFASHQDALGVAHLEVKEHKNVLKKEQGREMHAEVVPELVGEEFGLLK